MEGILDLTPYLHPEIAEALKKQPEIDYGRVRDFARVREARAVAATPAPEGVRIVNATVPGYPDGDPAVPVRVYSTEECESRDTLVWIHGGGFVLGSLNDNDPVGIQLARNAGCNVVSVDYRLAPEHPFPAGINDCYAALRWVADGPELLGGRQDQLAVAGGSAGGCLAAGVTLMARDLSGPALCHQLLVVPVLDDRLETRSSRVIHDPRIWNRKNAELAWTMYLGADRGGEVSPYASPAREKDLAGLPSATVLVADMDLLRDEGVGYANRLTASGVRADLVVYAGTCHGHTAIAPRADVSRRTVRDVLEAVRIGFGRSAFGDRA